MFVQFRCVQDCVQIFISRQVFSWRKGQWIAANIIHRLCIDYIYVKYEYEGNGKKRQVDDVETFSKIIYPTPFSCSSQEKAILSIWA